jgi:hypothetical protein
MAGSASYALDIVGCAVAEQLAKMFYLALFKLLLCKGRGAFAVGVAVFSDGCAAMMGWYKST